MVMQCDNCTLNAWTKALVDTRFKRAGEWWPALSAASNRLTATVLHLRPCLPTGFSYNSGFSPQCVTRPSLINCELGATGGGGGGGGVTGE